MVWREVLFSECRILEEHHNEGWIRVTHSSFGGPRIFRLSKKGRWYWLGPGKTRDGFYDKNVILV